MISSAEVARSIYGAWRLARFDADGLRYFDNTPEAFWRSFFAAIIVAPAIIVLVIMQLADNQIDSGPAYILLAETISYVIEWVAFPLLALYLADMLDRSDRFLRYIAARNWAIVIQMALFLAIAMLELIGLLGPGPVVALGICATFAILVYQWFVTRVGLDISAPAAAGVVFLDLVIGIVLNFVTNGLLR